VEANASPAEKHNNIIRHKTKSKAEQNGYMHTFIRLRTCHYITIYKILPVPKAFFLWEIGAYFQWQRPALGGTTPNIGPSLLDYIEDDISEIDIKSYVAYKHNLNQLFFLLKFVNLLLWLE
jgi:hypothetical protein